MIDHVCTQASQQAAPCQCSNALLAVSSLFMLASSIEGRPVSSYWPLRKNNVRAQQGGPPALCMQFCTPVTYIRPVTPELKMEAFTGTGLGTLFRLTILPGGSLMSTASPLPRA